jgi:predicted nucleotidyltransferase
MQPLEPLAIYHFGSTARQTACSRVDSDIDLAFYASEPKDPYQVFEIAQVLARHHRCDVDLVDLSRSTVVMAAQIIGTGKRIHKADPLIVDTFEMHTLANFAKLNEERKPVLTAQGV